MYELVIDPMSREVENEVRRAARFLSRHFKVRNGRFSGYALNVHYDQSAEKSQYTCEDLDARRGKIVVNTLDKPTIWHEVAHWFQYAVTEGCPFFYEPFFEKVMHEAFAYYGSLHSGHVCPRWELHARSVLDQCRGLNEEIERLKRSSKASAQAQALDMDMKKLVAGLWPDISMHGDFRSLYKMFADFEEQTFVRMAQAKKCVYPLDLDTKGDLLGNDIVLEERIDENLDCLRFLGAYANLPESGQDSFYHQVGFNLGAAMHEAEKNRVLTREYIINFFLVPEPDPRFLARNKPFAFYFIVKKDLQRKGYKAGLDSGELEEFRKFEETFKVSGQRPNSRLISKYKLPKTRQKR